MTTALLGFRPALAAPGRPARFAVCQPLPKTDFRRHGTAEPPLASSTDQPQFRPHPRLAPLPPPEQTAEAPQTAEGAKWTLKSLLPNSFASWQGKLLFCGTFLWSAVLYWQAGKLFDVCFMVLSTLFVLLDPLRMKW